MDKKIKIGFCVAYDWHLLEYALPQVYASADLICLSIDKDRISWSGNAFAFVDDAFKSLVKKIDIQNKIRIYEDDFHLPSLTPMQNEVRQRNLMAKFMKDGGWHIQLDCDEYFIAFEKFVHYLKSLSLKNRRTNICCAWVTVYKKTDAGYLYILPKTKEQLEYIAIATLQPDYKFGRRNGDFNIYTDYTIVHQSWARPDEEILQKIKNWGHRDDFDVEEYFQKWKSLNKDNYQSYINFHPIQSEQWPSLQYLEARSMDDFIAKFSWSKFPYSSFQLWLKNSRIIAKVKKGVSILTGK